MAGAVVALASFGADATFRWSNGDGTCLDNAYYCGVSRLAAAPEAAWSIFRNPKLGIEFSYPNDRRVTVGCRGSATCVALVEKTKRSGNYLVAFEVFEGNLDRVAVDQAVFQKQEEHWVAKGRNGTYPAEPLSGPGWQGIKSVVDCGISDTSGFHAGAGECLWAVVSDGRRSVVVDTPGTGASDENTVRSILSIRFSAP